jgi:hypothetical protein
MRLEAKLENRRTGGLRDSEIDREARRRQLVTLSAENEGLEFELEPFVANLTGPQPESPEVDRRHAPERSAIGSVDDLLPTGRLRRLPDPNPGVS